jgi:hypothetical protein
MQKVSLDSTGARKKKSISRRLMRSVWSISFYIDFAALRHSVPLEQNARPIKSLGTVGRQIPEVPFPESFRVQRIQQVALRAKRL